MTIVEDKCAITGGVDTHADVHVAAALDPVGGLLGVGEFPASPAGYARLLGWLGGFGTVALVGIEGTGSYGAGLARHITAAGIRVVEVDRSDRQDRRRQGKSDPLDAVSAARAAQSGRARGGPKGRDGAVEAIRALMVAKRSAAGERTRTINDFTRPTLLGGRPRGLSVMIAPRAKISPSQTPWGSCRSAAPARQTRRIGQGWQYALASCRSAGRSENHSCGFSRWHGSWSSGAFACVISKTRELAMTCYRPGIGAAGLWLPGRTRPAPGWLLRLAIRWACTMSGSRGSRASGSCRPPADRRWRLALWICFM